MPIRKPQEKFQKNYCYHCKIDLGRYKKNLYKHFTTKQHKDNVQKHLLTAFNSFEKI